MLGDIFTGGFFSATSAGILATMPSVQITVNAMDFTAAFYNSITNPAKNSFSNALEIEFGGFAGSFKQILSRWTWELPQTMLGNTYSHYIKPEFKSLLKSLRISPKWYDYLSWGNNLYTLFYAGFGHATYYNSNPVQP